MLENIRLIAVDTALLFLAYGTYRYPLGFARCCAVFAWIVLLPVMILIFKIGPMVSCVTVIVFNGIQYVFITMKSALDADFKEWDIKIGLAEGKKKACLEELGILAKSENDIVEKERAIANLYEITRKMSEHLRFDEIFGSFSEFLKDNFKFLRCDLMIIGHDGPGLRVERVYTLRCGPDEDAGQQKVSHEGLIKVFAGNAKDAFVLNSKDDKSGSFVAIPLLSENRIVGILAIDGITKDKIEDFVILSAQFALEIKKVLLYEMVERLAITDSLTGLYVRRYFSERVAEELQRSRRHKMKFAFLMIDIDDFKKCNDSYGHLVGDMILKELARIIKDSIREIDLASRYGGEEFSIVLPETDSQNASMVAERLRKKVEENVFRAYDEKLAITVSIGTAIYPEDADSLSSLVERADMALYNAKKSGKNIVRGYKKGYNNSL